MTLIREASLANVLHSITSLDVGGAQHMLARHLAGMSNSEYKSTVLSLMELGPLAEKTSKYAAEVVGLDLKQGQVSVSKLPKMRRIFKRAEPDLVHGWMYHGNIAATIGRFITFPTRPVIWGVHHTLYDPMTEKPLTRRLISLSARLSSRTRAIVYCSRVSAEQHETVGFNSRNRVIIYNGIECDRFTPDVDAKSRLAKLIDVPVDRLIVGSFGRAHPMKSPEVLVHAIAQLLKQKQNVQGLFVGAGHENGIVRKLAIELGISDRISTLGVQSDPERLMPGLDLHVISSSWGETFSLATAEAMASGVPAIVTDVGDCSWVVGNTGISVPRNNSEALGAAIGSLLEAGAEARRELGRRARLRVIENFSIEQYLAKYLALYDEILHHT